MEEISVSTILHIIWKGDAPTARRVSTELSERHLGRTLISAALAPL